MIAMNPSISAVKAAEVLGVCSRTVQTYLTDLKESVIDRIGPDKGGKWKIIIE